MAKPICVIYLSTDGFSKTKSSLNEELEDIRANLQEHMGDYHVFVIPDTQKKSQLATFQVFHEKDFTEIQYQELKQLIESKLSSLTTTEK